MPNYNQILMSEDDLEIRTYYKNHHGQKRLQNVYVKSIDGDTVLARRGETDIYIEHTKAKIVGYINFGCFSYEAP